MRMVMWLVLLPTVIASKTVLGDVFDWPIETPEVRAAFAENAQRLHKTESLAGHFEQRKKIKVLSRPIVSKGAFSYIRDRAFSWQVTAPINVAYHVQGDEFYTVQSGQKRSISQRKEPVLHGFLSVFVQVLGADYSQLEKHFNIYFESQDGRWQVGLTPKSSLVAKSITALVISGEDHVKALTITEPTGDSTEIDFVVQPNVTQAIQ